MTGEPSGARAVAGANPAKDALRAQLRARRSSLSLPDGDRTRRALDLCAGCAVVAAYASVAGEPDSWDLIDALTADGVRVLLPLIGRRPDWAWYTGRDQLVPVWRGILQPAGEPLGAAALTGADWIWVPGLAATAAGDRLGTGGGWYDRALAHTAPGTPVGLLLFDGEVLDALPTQPWDRRVDWILTSSATLRAE
ncbi:MAG: 5-formyltetrahydrofolate cyclo-ligase [Propionibacteriaceae bacterium]|nr:5-formyltetrahydrofolate cyclo-ligase [Propionibacteriaceae bacterium]